MQSSAQLPTYAQSLKEHLAVVQIAAKLVAPLSNSESCDLIESDEMPVLANEHYKKVHLVLYRVLAVKPSNRSDIMLTREVFHALKQKVIQHPKYKFFSGIRRVLKGTDLGEFLYDIPQAKAHKKIISKAQQSGAPSSNGMCYGLAASSLMALAMNELPLFDARAKRHCHSSIFSERKISRYMQNKAAFQDLNESEQEDAVFFQVVDIFQRSFLYGYLYDNSKRKYQDFMTTVGLVAPDRLPVLMRVGINTGIYSRANLAMFFDRIEDVLILSKKSAPVGILITNIKHAVSVSYDFERNKWRLVNASASALVSKEYIADWVMGSYGSFDADNIVLNFQFITPESNMLECNQRFIDLKVWHDEFFNSVLETAKTTQDFASSNVIQVAALNGDVDTVEKLISCQVDLNAFEKFPPLLCAVQNAHLQIIEILVRAGADVNFQAAESILSIPALAISLGNHEVISRLLDTKKVDLEKTHRQSLHQFDVMCGHHNLPVKRKEQFLQAHRQGEDVVFTALDLPGLFGNLDVVEVLEKYQRSKVGEVIRSAGI